MFGTILHRMIFGQLVRVFLLALISMPGLVEARRVALVIGQNAYPGGASATIGLPHLDNPVLDAHRMAEILVKHGFDVISCDGKTPGCFDLDRNRFLDALKQLETRAAGADLALVFFAGHGLASEEGNVLTPSMRGSTVPPAPSPRACLSSASWRRPSRRA